MKEGREYDRWMLSSVIILVLIGIVMVYSASAVIALERYHDSFFFLKRQVIYVLAGAAIMVIMMKIPYLKLKTIAPVALFLNLFCLIFVLIPPFGKKVGGSYRWFDLGFVRFQPSEMAKMILVLYFSYSLVEKKDKIKDFAFGYLPHILILGLFSLLFLLEPDLGTTFIVGLVSIILFVSGRVKVKYIFLSFLFSLPFLAFIIMKMPHAGGRWKVYLDPYKYAAKGGYQLIQSFLAIGGGGALGKGLGGSSQKLFYLPEPHTDFIFSIIAEEWGSVGVYAVIFLFFVFFVRGFTTYWRCSEPFGKFVALGLTLNISIQALVNISVVSGLLPTKGLTLPLISYGGSSLLVTMASVGILLNISGQRVKWRAKR